VALTLDFYQRVRLGIRFTLAGSGGLKPPIGTILTLFTPWRLVPVFHYTTKPKLKVFGSYALPPFA